MALTVSARSRWTGPSTSALIRGAALGAAAGVGLSITEYTELGKWLTVAGVLAMIVGLHRFGRSGADEPIRFQLAPLKRKKKKKKSSPVAAESAEAEDPVAGAAPSPGDGESSDGL